MPIAQPPEFPSSARSGRWLWRLPRLAVVLFLAAVAGLLWLSDRSESEEQRTTLISDVLWLEQNLHFQLTRNEEQLARIAPQAAATAATFEPYARALLDNETGLTQVAWMSASGEVHQALPPVATSFDHANNGAASALQLAVSVGKPFYSEPYPVAGEDWQFQVFAPIFQSGHLAGVAVGTYSIRRMLEKTVPWWFTERYQVRIQDLAGNTLGTRSKVEYRAADSTYQIDLDPPGQGMILQATPFQTPRPIASRLLSAALIFLAGVVLWSLWALRRHVQRRLAAEQALQEEHAFRKAMEDSVQTGLRARDLEGRITSVNPAFCAMVGWTADELIGRAPPMPYWVDEDIETTRALHDRILAGEGPDRGFEIRLKRRNGEIFPALIHEAPLIDARGRQTGWMSSVVDISDQKRAEELERQQQERLQATARLVTMGEMASSLAHELNQPLAAIASYSAGSLNLLKTDRPDLDGIQLALTKSMEQARRAGRIIRRIYEFVRRSEPKIEDCQADTLVDEAMALVEADARRLGIVVVRDIAPDLPAFKGDRVLLGQALLNLIRNAMDSLREVPLESRRVTVAAREADGQILISVTDAGTGISPESAAHLFEPFFTTKEEGMGMGLNICRSVIEGHRGRLWFEANPAGGSIFHILLPSDGT